MPSLELLSAEAFSDREMAQKSLEAWALGLPDDAAVRLLQHVKTSDDPEVRARCLAVLRRLADEDYKKQGQGYIGIRMQDELSPVPGRAKPMWGIRVMQVVAGSAAEQADLRMNDLVVGMEGYDWPVGEASAWFRNQVMNLKPGEVVNLEIVRQKEIQRIQIKLGKMPAILKQGIRFGGAFESPEEAEAREREEHYQVWLEKLVKASQSP